MLGRLVDRTSEHLSYVPRNAIGRLSILEIAGVDSEPQRTGLGDLALDPRRDECFAQSGP